MTFRKSWVAVIGLWILWIQTGGTTQAQARLEEVEVTVDWIRAIEPDLAKSMVGLESYDGLAYGKGRFLRLEGKSRKSMLLVLDKDDKQLVRLFDLPPFDLKLFSSGREYYFGGVLSNVERNPAGGIEVTITYANLSEVEGRFYSKQAKDFVARTAQIKQRNQAILGGPEPAPSQKPSSEPAPVTSVPAVPPAAAQPEEDKPAPRAQSAKPTEKEETEDQDDLPRNRPVLKRRMGEEPEQSAGQRQESEPSVRVRPTVDDDVVIYRRREGSRKSVGSPSSPSAEPNLSEPDTLDRPILRRQPAATAEKEADGMMLVPAGSVTLGSDQPGDIDKPLHRVEVQAFYLDKYEVTNADYKQFCDATAHTVPPYWVAKNFPSGLDKHPVVQVSWTDAVAFAKWAGKRLPTEAEWERAAKGPNSYRYAYGNVFDTEKANSNTQKTSAVGSYPANEFGLFDMTGNASEWTSSLYLPYPYSASDGREDPKAAGARTVRGGNHSSNEQNARCLVRQKELPDHGSPLLGFRCARDSN